MDTQTSLAEMTITDALGIAIESLHKEAEGYSFDARAVKIWGERVPSAVRKTAERQKLILQAVTVLTGLKQRGVE